MSAPSRHSRLAIGLTGGIGSGKTTVSDQFRALGIEVIDADEIARNLLGKDSPLLDTVIRQFGPAVADGDGNLDRAAVRRIIFEDASARQWLEALLHPAIREEIQQRLKTATSPYVIVVIPLLTESGQYGFLDRIAVVDVPEHIQVERTMARDSNPRALVEKILASQASRQARLAHADDIIDNSGTPAALQERVEALHSQYLTMVSPQV